MQTFNEKLKKQKVIFDSMAITHNGYKKTSMLEVKAYNLQYRKETGLYPYNDNIVKFITKHKAIDIDLIDHLGTEVFLSQQDIRADEKKAQDDKMIAKGWLVIPQPPETCAYRGKIIIRAIKENGFLSSEIDGEGKLVDTTNNHGSFFIPKGKRSRGYYFELLKGYYKQIN